MANGAARQPSLAAFRDELAVLAQKPKAMIVMGAPLPGCALDRPQLRRWSRKIAAENTLTDCARAWLPLDIDGCTLPAGLGAASRLIEAGTHVRDRSLPEEFREVGV